MWSAVAFIVHMIQRVEQALIVRVLLSVNLVERFSVRSKSEVYNLYGPGTELIIRGKYVVEIWMRP